MAVKKQQKMEESKKEKLEKFSKFAEKINNVFNISFKILVVIFAIDFIAMTGMSFIRYKQTKELIKKEKLSNNLSVPEMSNNLGENILEK